MKEDAQMPDNKRKFPDEDTQYGDSCAEEICLPTTQSVADHKRFKFDADEPDFTEEPLEFEDEADLIDFDIDVDDPSETVCCICDNGGDVICCDGPCMRSFHVNKDVAGARDCDCSTLGLNKAETERMDLFFCPNCKYKEHQCYICNKLGCSNEAAGDAQEVFLCDSAMCGHFYHADCVAKTLLKDAKKAEQDSLIKSIRLGKGFVCPMHKCWKCGRGEDKEIWESQFGVCRRCPRVWHRKCFPTFVRFKEENDKPQRAWEGLLSDRVLIYCIEHKINRKLSTPARTQAVFPEVPKWVKKNTLEDKKKKRRLVKLHLKEGMKVGLRSEEKPALDALKSHMTISLKSKQERPAVNEPVEAKFGEAGTVSQKIKIKQATPHSTTMIKESRKDAGNSFVNEKGPTEAGIRKLQYDEVVRKSKKTMHLEDRGRNNTYEQRSCKFLAVPHLQAKWTATKPVTVDYEMRSMIRELISKTKCLITLESIHKKHDTPFCYKRNPNNLDKKYSMVKIESIMKGTRKAVQTLEGNGSMEDAKTQCAPDYLKFLEGCKKELRVFLAPFLYGARYTPFGRHFTQLDKLKQIVEKLHLYVQNGDTVVDFCCGSNDFSLLMKAKLDQMRKTCYYKNFDIIQSQDSFNFVKKDWFKVTQNELAEGSKLVIGLNPPFGVKGSLANLFIDHALSFRPKLLVLIVPKETQRLDRKQSHYDLICEDPELLKGKSFYLPGSVDIYGKPLMDWNVVPPPLFLWSRPDWSLRHRQIALENGHVSKCSDSRKSNSVDLNCQVQKNTPKHPMQRGHRLSEARGGHSDPMIHKDIPKKRSRSLDGNHVKVSLDGCQQAFGEHFDVSYGRHRIHHMRRMQSKHVNYERHATGKNTLRQDSRDQRGAIGYESSGAYEKPPHIVQGVHESSYYNAQRTGGTWAPGFSHPDVKLGENFDGYPSDLDQSVRNIGGLRPLNPYGRLPMDMAQSAQKFDGMASGGLVMVGLGQPASNVYRATCIGGAPMDMALHPSEVSRYNYGPAGRQYRCENGAQALRSDHRSIEHQQYTGCHQNGNYRIV